MDKRCENCKYYVRYYTLNISFRFVRSDKGFCSFSRKSGSIKKCNALACDYWAQVIDKTEENITRFKYKFFSTLKNIKHIIDLIKSDFFE